MRLGSAISFISLGFPPAPRTLGANGWCLPLPAALPWLCLCCQRKGRAQELGGSIQAVAMDGCCSPSREGSRLPAGNTLVSAWREGADLASAGVSTEAPGTWQCTHAVWGVGTVCHPNTAAATSQPLSHPECLDVPRGHQHKMDVWLPMLASPTRGTGSHPVQVGDFGVLCPQAWSPWEGICQDPNWKNIISGLLTISLSFWVHVFVTRACI